MVRPDWNVVSLKIVLMGTGEFALPTFRHLVQSEAHQVVGLFTQPERSGRGHHRHVNPVRVLGEENGIPVFQPHKVNDPDVLQQLRSLQADVFVVAAYGQIMKQELLEIPRLGAFNLHGSLLPKYRGAAPVQYSIWKGESVGGVTMFQIEQGLDSGPMVGTVQSPITGEDTSGSLMARLAQLSVSLTVDVLQKLEDGSAEFVEQDSTAVTLAPKIQKQEGIIDWKQSASAIDCHIRAMQPWPRASTSLLLPDRKPLRCLIQKATPCDDSFSSSPGTLRKADDGAVLVATGDGCLKIESIQPEGKKAMDASGFANGYLSAGKAAFGSCEASE